MVYVQRFTVYGLQFPVSYICVYLRESAVTDCLTSLALGIYKKFVARSSPYVVRVMDKDRTILPQRTQRLSREKTKNLFENSGHSVAGSGGGMHFVGVNPENGVMCVSASYEAIKFRVSSFLVWLKDS